MAPRLSKSGIEYLDYMWGIWSGCHNWENGVCGGGGNDFNCWAKGLATRFTNLYPNGFDETFYPEALDSPKLLKKPSLIGVGWVGDIIGYCVAPAVKIAITDTIRACPQHTFLFLTKNPFRLIEWEFPDNCWVGGTATDRLMWFNAIWQLLDVKATVKFLSFEPLLSWQHPEKEPIDTVSFTADWFRKAGINWVIIGAQTKPYRPPKIEWVREIVEACDKAGIPVFLKDNLRPLIPFTEANSWLFESIPGVPTGIKLRQELPKEVRIERRFEI